MCFGGQLGNTGSSCEERELVSVCCAVPGVFLSCFEGAAGKVTQPLVPSANVCSVPLLARPRAKGWGHRGGRASLPWSCSQLGSADKEPRTLRQGLGQVEPRACRAGESSGWGRGASRLRRGIEVHGE